MERAALNGTDVRGLQETIEYLNEVMDKAMRDQAAAGAENQAKKELLGSEIYSQILSAVPKKGWDSIIDILPREDLVKLASCCKGLHLLTKSKLEVNGGRTMGAASPETEELAVALFNLHALGRQRLAEATEREPPGTGYLRVLQAVCVLLTGERVDLTRVWSCADYLFHETNPMVKLAEKVRDPEQVTSQQAVWILDMFAAHADDMALACDEVLGALFSLVVCLMQCLRAKHPELPPLHLPHGYTPCSDRNNNKSKAVSSLLD